MLVLHSTIHSLLFLGIKAKNFFIVIQILRKTRNDTYPINKLFNKFLVNYILIKLGRLADGRGWNPSKNSFDLPCISKHIYQNNVDKVPINMKVPILNTYYIYMYFVSTKMNTKTVFVFIIISIQIILYIRRLKINAHVICSFLSRVAKTITVSKKGHR